MYVVKPHWVTPGAAIALLFLYFECIVGVSIREKRRNAVHHIRHQKHANHQAIHENCLDVTTTLTLTIYTQQRLSYHRHHLKNLLIIVGPNTLQPPPHRLRIFTHMLTIPPITPTIVIRKRRFQTFKRHICTTHNGLPHVIEAVDHVPVIIFFEFVARGEAGVDGGDGV
jgi:hypothetical protein